MSTVVVQDLEQFPRVELVNYYCPGGFHPVHLNDTFKNGQYRVINKLGYGSYGTVWLVYDTILKRYASLKILAAEVSDSYSEITVIQHLQQHATGSGKEYVVEIFDFFQHTGPNGLHHCIVMEVLGPPISSDIEKIYPDEAFPIEVAKRISAQISHGLAYIHTAGIVHGDLHMSNILLHSPIISSWTSDSDFEKYFGRPRQRPLTLLGTDELAAPSPHIPSYLVFVNNRNSLLKLCLSDPTQIHVKICDFGEAFIPTMQLTPLPPRGIPIFYAAPEVIFGDPSGLPADIWALAVLICYIIEGGFIFSSYRGIRKEVIKSMVLTLGKLPERWWFSWEERSEWFNEDGEWWKNGVKIFPKSNGSGGKPKGGGGEIATLNEITRRMIKYDPKERASIDEVIEWMNQNGWFVN
ncbi:hypothetical protein Clacol_000421 [Clathrus columnatus]|uniref:non-specific serine/threonine protein kinase n=1 Tax=Clathrus columnatus TaxID=1419009 RepID=A0AAV5A0W9_9AGAM|nr:hypothetical protein Clacol_000421 [Clathrus columnatus]